MSKIILKKSSVVNKVPLAADLDYGELALNYADSKLYFKASDNTIASIDGDTGGAIQDRRSYIATAGQTTFTIKYISNYVDVYLNGLRLSAGSDYTATDGFVVVLTQPALANDLVEFVAQRVRTVQILDDTKLAKDGGTLTGIVTFAAGQTFPGTQLVGTTTLTTTAANQAVDTFDKTQYRTAKYFIQATAAGSVHITEILLTHDDTDVYIVEYGTILTGNSLITVGGSVNGTNVTLTITPVNAGTILDFSRTVLVARSLVVQEDLNTQSGSVDLNSSSGSEDLNA